MKSVLSLILVICTAAMSFAAFAESTPMGDMPSDIGQPPEGMGEPPEGMPGEPPREWAIRRMGRRVRAASVAVPLRAEHPATLSTPRLLKSPKRRKNPARLTPPMPPMRAL